VVVRKSVELSGMDLLAVTKLDVLTGLDELKICVAYELDGRKIKHVPADLKAFSRCRPVYESLPGWQEDIGGAKELADLPQAARKYLVRLSKLTGAPLGLVSVGPERAQTIMLQHPFTIRSMD
jgi:adenylosuccinate synthase